MNNDQQVLASLVAKRNAAAADYERYRQAAKSLTQSEQVANKATEEAAAQLEAAMVAKIKGDGDGDTSAARAAYHTAIAALAVAEAEARAGQRVVAEAEALHEALIKQAAHAAANTCKAIAAHEEIALLDAAEAYGKQLAKRRAITRAARAASATTGLNSDPVSELNGNCPLTLKLEELINGKDLDAISYSEQDLLAARIGGANGG